LERFLPLRQAVRTRKSKLRGVQHIDLPNLGQLLRFALRLGREVGGPGLLSRKHLIHAYKDVGKTGHNRQTSSKLRNARAKRTRMFDPITGLQKQYYDIFSIEKKD
jgi:hypothetical protein